MIFFVIVVVIYLKIYIVSEQGTIDLCHLLGKKCNFMHTVCHCEETNEASTLVKPGITSHEDMMKSLGINI